MPAKSAKQQRLMAGVAHGTIKGTGIPKSVAKEFSHKPKSGYKTAKGNK